MDLAKVLADMRANGVTEAQYEEKEGCVTLKVAFGAAPLLVGKDGATVDLNAGMGPLEKDPLGEDDDAPRPEGSPDVAADANFVKPDAR